MLDIVYARFNNYTATLRKKRRIEVGDPVLAWLIFAGLNLLTFLLLWFYGFLQKAIDADPTHIAVLIASIYVATSLHCLWRCILISRETEAAERLEALLTDRNSSVRHILKPDGTDYHRRWGIVGAHIQGLITKSKLLAKDQKLDQTLMLRVLAQRLNGSTPFGAFASDLVMKLGLFGTIVGFIMMLAPIATLNADDQGAIKSSMGLMSGGMAVAMYTTLVGLAGSILIKIEYLFVELATARLFTAAVALTEMHVIPFLESGEGDER